MDLELWIQAILMALENKIRHLRFLFIPVESYDYTAFVGDTKTQKEYGIQFFKCEKKIKKFETAEKQAQEDFLPYEIASRPPPSQMYA